MSVPLLPKSRKRDRLLCVVPNCVSSTGTLKQTTSSITFHAFPSNISTRNLWLSWLNIPAFVPNKGNRICSKHFTLDDYEQNVSLLDSFGLDTPTRMRLRVGVCPSIRENVIINSQQDGFMLLDELPIDMICATIPYIPEATESTTSSTITVPEIQFGTSSFLSPQKSKKKNLYMIDKETVCSPINKCVLQPLVPGNASNKASKYIQTCASLIPEFFKNQQTQTPEPNQRICTCNVQISANGVKDISTQTVDRKVDSDINSLAQAMVDESDTIYDYEDNGEDSDDESYLPSEIAKDDLLKYRKPPSGSQQSRKPRKESKEHSEIPSNTKETSGDEDEMQIVPERLIKIKIVDTRIIMQQTGSVNGLFGRPTVLTRDFKESITDLDDNLPGGNSCSAKELLLAVILDHAYSRIKEKKIKAAKMPTRTRMKKGKSRKPSCIIRRKRRRLPRSSDETSSGSDFESSYYSKRRRRKPFAKKYNKTSDSETVIYTASDDSRRPSSASESDSIFFPQTKKEKPSSPEHCKHYRFQTTGTGIPTLKSEINVNPNLITASQFLQYNEQEFQMHPRIKCEIMSDSETVCSDSTPIGLPFHADCTISESLRTPLVELELPFCALSSMVNSMEFNSKCTTPGTETFITCNLKSEIISPDE